MGQTIQFEWNATDLVYRVSAFDAFNIFPPLRGITKRHALVKNPKLSRCFNSDSSTSLKRASTLKLRIEIQLKTKVKRADEVSTFSSRLQLFLWLFNFSQQWSSSSVLRMKITGETSQKGKTPFQLHGFSKTLEAWRLTDRRKWTQSKRETLFTFNNWIKKVNF